MPLELAKRSRRNFVFTCKKSLLRVSAGSLADQTVAQDTSHDPNTHTEVHNPNTHTEVLAETEAYADDDDQDAADREDLVLPFPPRLAPPQRDRIHPRVDLP